MNTPCLCCGQDVEAFLSFGSMPLANAFVAPGDSRPEYRYSLAVGICSECTMVQLLKPVPREKLFHEAYAYYSSTSSRMSDHFRRFAADVHTQYLVGQSPLVVELGSNDGIMLQHFVDRGVRCLGIEPSANVASAAKVRGIPTICRFFDETLARQIAAEHGRANAILAANVLCHIQDLHGALQGMRALLTPEGVVVCEDPYLGDLVSRTAYDQIYDEHIYYFSLASLQSAFASHDFELIDASRQEVHGGSMRYTFAAAGTRKVMPAVFRLRQVESELGLSNPETFHRFRQRVERSRQELIALLATLTADGRRVVGYGATSKSTTVINYCGLTTQHIAYISDTTPGKQGKLTPGAHIPVQPREHFLADHPEYALLFAWNHQGEVLEKEAAFTSAGGKWIVYVPEVGIL